MSTNTYPSHYLESLLHDLLDQDVDAMEFQRTGPDTIRITGRIHAGDSDAEEVRRLLEDIVEDALPGWTAEVDGTFVDGELPPNFLARARSIAHFPDAIYQVRGARKAGGRYGVTLWVRHQETFLGRKRNRARKLAEAFPEAVIELRSLGSQATVKELNTLPSVHAWLRPFVADLPGFKPEHVHAYKVDTGKEGIRLFHNASVTKKHLDRLARNITRATDILVTFEHRTSRADARAAIEVALGGLSWLEGYRITFQEKQSLFIVAADTDQSRKAHLADLARRLQGDTGFRVDIQIDIQRDVMVSRLLDDFPEDGIVTAIKHIDASMFEVEAYIPFDPARERLEAWSDQMEARWGAKILFTDPFMRAPDVRYRHLRGSDAETIALRYNRPLEFPPETIAQARTAAVIDWQRELQRRTDIRKTVVLSIDPERTKDIDDALSVVETGAGDLEVGVHIADVSAFVEPGSPLDQEAVLRGFTTYLVEGEIPVIPEVLANQACSLHGNEDSLCLSVFMTLTPRAELLDFRVERTVIHNHARLNYREAQAILDGTDHPYAWQVRTLGALSQRMRQARKATGALDLSLDEDPEKPSHQLIEEFMLLANECVGRFVRERHPEGLCLYRVHPDVTETSLAALSELARHLGVGFKITNQETMQQALESLLGTPKFDIFRFHVGRVLEKATYHVDPLGHGALAKEDYAHFTSPIRRYTDLIIHRLVGDILESFAAGRPRPDTSAASAGDNQARRVEDGGETAVAGSQSERESASRPPGEPKSVALPSGYTRESLMIIADHLNHVEVRVDAASFESHRLADLQFYDGARRQFSGRILSFMRGRMAIKLDQTDLMVYVRYQDFRQNKMMPLSVNDDLTSRYYALGQEVAVRTEGVNWAAKSIDARVIG